MLLLLFTITSFLLLIWWGLKFARIPEKFPNGPFGVPFLGYFPLLTAESILTCLESLHQQYGPNLSINMGPSRRIVILGDFETLKEAFKEDALTARPPDLNWFNVLQRYGNGSDSRGLIFSHGPEWSEQRRFALRSLRDLGFGKSSMEELIHQEVLQLIDYLNRDLDHPINISDKFNISVINALWTIMTGSRYSLDDAELLEVVKKTDVLIKQNSTTSPLMLMPFLRHIFPEWTGWNNIVRSMNNIFEFLATIIDDHSKKFGENPELKEHPNDFIDLFLAQIHTSPLGSSFHGVLGYQNLRSVILDLLITGTETTSTALSWAILYLIRHPDVQRKVQEELDKVIANSRLPEVQDRQNLPYTEAVIQEILRCACIAPFSIPRYAEKDVSLQDGKIVLAAGTTVMGNLFHILNNPKVFRDPEQFMPERFLDKNGNFLKNDHNIIFSIGKRDCLGKSLAQTEMFLFFSALLQRYSFKSIDEDNLEKLSLKPKVGFSLSPQPYQVIVSKRNIS